MTYGSMSLIEELICLVVMFIYIEKKKKITNGEKRSSLENLGAISAGKFTRRSNLIKNSKEQP